MKKKVIIFMLAAVCFFSAGIFTKNYLQNNGRVNISGLVLDNIEALADVELPPVTIICGLKDGPCWVKSRELKMCGEYNYYPSIFDGRQMWYCKSVHTC